MIWIVSTCSNLKLSLIAKKYLLFLPFLLLFSSPALSTPTSLMYQGRILKSDGLPLQYSAVSFIFQITNPNGACIIYEEQVSNYDMTNSNGIFETPIGLGVRSYPASGTSTVLDSLDNSAPLVCKGGSTYSPSLDDGRKLRVLFHDGVGWKTIAPDSIIRSVPYAAYAASATKFANKPIADFVLKNIIPTCLGGTVLSWNGSVFSCVSAAAGALMQSQFSGSCAANQTLTFSSPSSSFTCTNIAISASQVSGNISGTAAGFTGPLVGDVSGTQGATVVDRIKGVPLSMIGNGTGKVLTFDGTNWAPADLPAGNAGTVTGISSANNYLTVANGTGAATLTINVGTVANTLAAGNDPRIVNAIQNAGGAVSIQAGLDAAKGAPSVNGRIYMATDTQKIYRDNGSTLVVVASVDAVGGGGSVTEVTGSGPISVATGTTTPAISISQATTSTDGYLSQTDWDIFNNKLSAVTNAAPLADGTIWVGDGLNTAQARTVSGDATLSNAGALTIASGAVGLGKLAADSVNSSKIVDSSINVADLNFVGVMAANTGVVVRDGNQFHNKACTLGQILSWTVNGWDCASNNFTELDPKVGANTLNYLSKWDGSKLVASGVLENNSVMRITPTTAPGAAMPGDIFFDSTNGNKFRIYDTSWKTLAFNETGWHPGVYAPTGSGPDGQPDVFFNAMYNSAGVDGAASLLRIGAINTAGVYQNSYIGAVSNSAGYTSSIVFGQRLGVNSYSERMRIDQNGNVGIGIADPIFKLHVESNDTVSPGEHIVGLLRRDVNGGGFVLGYEADGSSVIASRIRGSGNFDLRIGTNGAPDTLTVGNTGNIGIGKTDPQAELDVNGVIRATNICDETGANCKDISAGWTSGGGGTVTSVTAGAGLVTSPGAGVTTTGSIGIAAGGVGTTELATDSVTAIKIKDGEVTGAKLENMTGLSAGTYGSGVAIPTITVDAKGRITTVTTNAITGLPSAAVSTGKYLKSDGTNWSGQDVRLSDLKNSSNGSAFSAMSGCLANQTMTWTLVTDTFGCQNIDSLDATKITGGVLDAARLPATVKYWQDGGAGDIYYNGGKVGIGTVSPVAKMHVEDSSTDTTLIGNVGLRLVNTDVTNNNYVSIKFATKDAGGGATYGGHIGAQFTSHAANSINGDLFFQTTKANSSSEVVRMTSAGNVGIGTASPTTKLDVAGTVTASATVEAGAAYVNSATAYVIPDSSMNVRSVLLTGNATVTLPAFAPAGVKVWSVTVFIKQDGTGGRTLTWGVPAGDSIKWDQAVTPSYATAIGKISIYQFVKRSDETVWYGSMVWREN